MRLAAAALASAAMLTIGAANARADGQTCDRVAAPNGDDSAAGTASAPLRSAQALADSLSPGQTGCLRSGTYYEDVRVNHGGSAGSPITLTSYPGERAKIVGRFYIPHGSDYVTVDSLDLNGTNQQGTNQETLPSPTIDSDHATFSGDDVTDDHTAICFSLGNESYGRATNTLIDHSRIHGCGLLPAANHNHGIYVATATGTQILDNVIYDNADRGIQLYPDAQQTTIRGNIIDGNGEGIIFSGDNGTAASDTDVEFNIITNSKIRNNVESWYPAGNPIGQRNVVAHNCISGGADDSGDGGIGDQTGYKVSETLTTRPRYANEAGGDFSLPSSDRCAQLLAGVMTTPPPTQPSSTGTPTSTTTSVGDGGSSSTPSAPVPPAGSGSRHAVTLHGHARGRILELHGRLRARRAAHAASAGWQRVSIEIHRGRHWRELATLPLADGRFSLTLELPAALAGARGAVALRAVVPSVGASGVMRLHLSR